MGSINTLHPQFIINEAGDKVSVVLSYNEFQELMEDIEDLTTIAERREEETIDSIAGEIYKSRKNKDL